MASRQLGYRLARNPGLQQALLLQPGSARVEAVGGSMTLDSPARAGTVLTVRLPSPQNIYLNGQ